MNTTPFARSARVARLLAGAALVAAGLTAAAAQASSAHSLHLALRRSEPAKDTTVTTPPKAISLWFTEPVKAPVTGVRLLGPNDTTTVVPTDPVKVDTASNAPAVAAIKSTLRPGKYVVAWRTMSADGHPVTGSFAFTLRAADDSR